MEDESEVMDETISPIFNLYQATLMTRKLYGQGSASHETLHTPISNRG